MRAIGYQAPLPITDEHSLVDVDLPRPNPAPSSFQLPAGRLRGSWYRPD